MAGDRQLNKPTDQRLALLRNQTSCLLWKGRIETTHARAKEVQKLAEKLITMAVKTFEDPLSVKKDKIDAKGKSVKKDVLNDGPQKLAARRRIMTMLYDLQEERGPEETPEEYRVRTKDVRHPLIEKMFNELAPRYAKRKEETGRGGGYTRVVRTGFRRGDAADMAIIELV
jgi:large subunit ribosomal protein L17